MKVRILGLAGALVGAACTSRASEPDRVGCAGAETDDLRLNQLQVVGSHNSYRRKTYAPLYAYVQNLAACLAEELDPENWDYDHPPLREQLDGYGVRGLEIDLFNDPDGGRFYDRQGLRFVGEPVASNIPELREPGFKVLHVPDFDYQTHHPTFHSALQEIAAWSAAHPAHVPLMIHLETKLATVADDIPDIGLTTALPWDAAAADALDAEIRAVLPVARLITPDEIRGGYATLDEAVQAGGWPTLAAARGRILLYMEGAAVDAYVTGAPGLRGRLVFAASKPGDAHAAVVIANDAISGRSTIADMVRRGYIVRTMADGGTVQARTGDTRSRDAALASGAHIVTTDYYRSDPRGATPGSGWTNYEVQVPGGGPARVNPINGGARGSLRICEPFPRR